MPSSVEAEPRLQEEAATRAEKAIDGDQAQNSMQSKHSVTVTRVFGPRLQVAVVACHDVRGKLSRAAGSLAGGVVADFLQALVLLLCSFTVLLGRGIFYVLRALIRAMEDTPSLSTQVVEITELVNDLYAALKKEVNAEEENNKIIQSVASHVGELKSAASKLFEYFEDVVPVVEGPLVSLHEAALSGCLADLQQLLSKGDDAVNDRDGRGDSPLHCAAQAGHTEVLTALLDAGAKVTPRGRRMRTPLHMAAEAGHLGVVRKLLDSGTEVNVEDKNGCTALTEAAAKGHCSVTELLLERGADTSKMTKKLTGNSKTEDFDTGKEGKTAALLEAIANGHYDVVRMLIEKGADVFIRDLSGRSPIHIAVIWGHKNVLCCLLEAGGNVNAQDSEGITALADAAARGFCYAAKLLIEKGADVKIRDKKGDSPLHTASRKGYISVVNTLLEHNAAVNVTNNFGETSLHLAAANGHLAVVRALLLYKANPTATDSKCQRPLQLAAAGGYIHILWELIDAAPQQIFGNIGTEAFIDAAASGKEDVMKVLLEVGVKAKGKNKEGRTAVYAAAMGEYRKCLNLLKCKEGNDGNEVLIIAAESGKENVVKLLLEAGVKANVRPGDKSPLYVAARQGHIKCIIHLLDFNADVNATWDHGNAARRTALHAAAENGHVDCIRMLLSNGANVNVQDANGDTPLHTASVCSQWSCIDVLLNAKACCEIVNKRGETAKAKLHSATRRLPQIL